MVNEMVNEFEPRLHGGDADRLRTVTKEIQEIEKIRSVVSHEGWQKVMADIASERDKWVVRLDTPDEYTTDHKVGVLHGLRLALGYAKTVEARLTFLYLDKTGLENLALKREKE